MQQKPGSSAGIFPDDFLQQALVIDLVFHLLLQEIPDPL